MDGEASLWIDAMAMWFRRDFKEGEGLGVLVIASRYIFQDGRRGYLQDRWIFGHLPEWTMGHAVDV